MNSLKLLRYKVILVGTKFPQNIGGMARLLENYAVGEGALVAPQCEWREGVAQWMATGPSIDRLNCLPVFDDLTSAVKDCQHVVGFTVRTGKERKSSMKIEDLGSKLEGKIALVFGREDFCLLKNEIDVCTHLCALDSNPKFPALNLSHSVAVVLAQLFLQENHSRRGHREIASVEEVEPMFEDLRASMISVGLNHEGNPERMLTRLRKIFQRADLGRDDVALLRGYFRKISGKDYSQPSS